MWTDFRPAGIFIQAGGWWVVDVYIGRAFIAVCEFITDQNRTNVDSMWWVIILLICPIGANWIQI